MSKHLQKAFTVWRMLDLSIRTAELYRIDSRTQVMRTCVYDGISHPSVSRKVEVIYTQVKGKPKRVLHWAEMYTFEDESNRPGHIEYSPGGVDQLCNFRG